MKSPAFQFYPTDWLGSQRVQMLTLEEEGAYMRLLCSCWQHGSIPADPMQAARLVGKGASTTLVTTVLTMFQPSGSDPTRLVHDRLDLERQKQANWREKSSQGGKKSAATRSAIALAKGGSRVVEPPNQPNGNSSVFRLPSSSPSSVSEIPNPPSPQPANGEGALPGLAASVPEPRNDPIPFVEILGAYNQLCPSMPRALMLEDRRKSMRARWLECQRSGNDPMAWFRTLFTKAEASDFLSGRKPAGNSRWRCGFDWLIGPKNAPKIIEGNYDNQPGFTDTTQRRPGPLWRGKT